MSPLERRNTVIGAVMVAVMVVVKVAIMAAVEVMVEVMAKVAIAAVKVIRSELVIAPEVSVPAYSMQ